MPPETLKNATLANPVVGAALRWPRNSLLRLLGRRLALGIRRGLEEIGSCQRLKGLGTKDTEIS